MTKMCHKKCCLKQVIISLTIDRKVCKSKEKGVTNKCWIVEYHMLSPLFGCYNQCWIGTKLEPWYVDWYCLWYQRTNNTGWT